MLSEFKQDTLQDVIRKYRQNEKNQSAFFSKIIDDIKKELANSDKDIKTTALIKLLFLYLNNKNIEWASFTTLEILTTCGIKGKLYAYLIAGLQFKNNNDYLQLIPNQIRSDLHKENLNNINSALNFFCSVVNINISNELIKDIEGQLNLNNNLIRKKVIISLTLCCEQFAKENDFTYWDDFLIKLITILENSNDNDSNKISLTIISCLQKMCKISPEHCITSFVGLMNYFNKCEINWNLIKIIDIFNMLFKYEPKFTKKKEFIKILSEQIVKTKSKSVEVELVKLIMIHFNPQINQNCVDLVNAAEERLKNLLNSSDNNLLILSLQILNITSKKADYYEDVIKIIDNYLNNKNILKECVLFLVSVSNKNNFIDIVEKIRKLEKIINKEVVDGIIEICSKNNYELIQNNNDNLLWFVNLLFELGNNLFLNLRKLNKNKISNTENKISQIIKNLTLNQKNIQNNIVEKCYEICFNLKDLNEIEENNNNNKKEDKIKNFTFKIDNNNIENYINNNNINEKKYYSTFFENIFYIISEFSDYKQIDKYCSKLIDLKEKFYNNFSIKNYNNYILCIIKLCIKNSEILKKNKENLINLINSNDNNEIENIEILSILNSLIFNENKFKNELNEELYNIDDLNLEECFPINNEELNFEKK